MLLPRLACAALALALTSSLPAQSTPHDSLLVLSKGAHTLSIVDPVTLKVLARVPVGNDPHEVIASTDGRTAFVSNYGFGAFNTLAVVDLTRAQALPSIDLGPLRGPHGLAFVGGKLWFTAEAAKAIGRYDPATSHVDWIMGTGQNRTHMIHVFPDLNSIITTNVSSATVSLINKADPNAHVEPPPPPPGNHPGPPPPHGPPGGDWDETVIPVGEGSEGFDVSPDGREIWVANARQGSISIIDRAARTVVATIPANLTGANRLKFTLDGRLVLISGMGSSPLTVYDAHTRTEQKRLAIGRGAAGIVLEPNGNRAFVACSPDNNVAVIDLHTLTQVGRIDAGPEPDGLAWATRP